MDPVHYVPMELPAIVVNVKTYRQATGEAAVSLAHIMEEVRRETGASLVIAVQAADIYRVAQAVDIPVWAQHLDPVTYGSHTGWTLPESLVEAGACGVLLNHSEHQLRIADIAAALGRARKAGLETIVCADNIAVTRAVAALEPDLVAVEPPGLIGGEVSVTSAEPEIVVGAVSAVESISPRTAVLCGAGVKTGEDIRTALELGAAGVLLASGVVKAAHPKKVLLEMAEALTQK